MSISHWIIIFLISLSLSGCNNTQQKATATLEQSLDSSKKNTIKQMSSTLLKSMITEKAFEILQNSSSAVYYSVKKDPSSEKDYLELNSPQELPSTFLNEIRSLLMDDSSYLFVSKKKSLFVPNLALEMRIQKEKLVHCQDRICFFDCMKAPRFDDRFDTSQNSKFYLDSVLVILIAAGCKQVRFIQGEEQLTLDCDPAFADLEKLINTLRRKKDD